MDEAPWIALREDVDTLRDDLGALRLSFAEVRSIQESMRAEIPVLHQVQIAVAENGLATAENGRDIKEVLWLMKGDENYPGLIRVVSEIKDREHEAIKKKDVLGATSAAGKVVAGIIAFGALIVAGAQFLLSINHPPK